MYTIHGLRTIIESNMEIVSVTYFNDAISNLKEYLEETEKGVGVIKEHFKKDSLINLIPYTLAAESYSERVEEGIKEVDKELFVDAFTMAERMLEINKQVYSEIKTEFEKLKWNTLPESQYLVLKSGKDAYHNLGMLNRDFDDFITVKAETDDYYVGSFWYSNFFNVYFNKRDVRPLTEEERLKENV